MSPAWQRRRRVNSQLSPASLLLLLPLAPFPHPPTDGDNGGVRPGRLRLRRRGMYAGAAGKCSPAAAGLLRKEHGAASAPGTACAGAGCAWEPLGAVVPLVGHGEQGSRHLKDTYTHADVYICCVECRHSSCVLTARATPVQPQPHRAYSCDFSRSQQSTSLRALAAHCGQCSDLPIKGAE